MSDFWTSQRVIVTGGTGFLGGHVCARLRQAGCEHVTALGRADANLCRQHDVELLDARYCPTMVIHCAGLVGGIQLNQARPGDMFYQNMLMGMNVIHEAAEHGLEKLVIVGTTCSYPDQMPGNGTYGFIPKHLWRGYPEATNAPYGVAKRALLTMAQAYREQYGLKTAFVTPANLYGPGDHLECDRSHVIPALIRKCLEAREAGDDHITAWGNGWATREFLYAGDAAEAIVLAAEKYDDPEALNIGTGQEIHIRFLADLIVELTEFRGVVKWDISKPEGQHSRCLNVNAVEQVLGWRAITSFRTGLQRTIEWCEDQACVSQPSLSPS